MMLEPYERNTGVSTTPSRRLFMRIYNTAYAVYPRRKLTSVFLQKLTIEAAVYTRHSLFYQRVNSLLVENENILWRFCYGTNKNR